MSFTIVDKRGNDKGQQTGNKKKFLKRVEGQIKKAIPNIVGNTSIKDITSGKGSIKVPIKSIEEPSFTYDPATGKKKIVHSGNDEYIPGDRIIKDGGYGRGRGRQGSNDPEIGQDEFVISISREEFLDYFFKDLELPDLVRKHLQAIVDYKRRKAGYIQFGVPSKLNIVKSYQNSLGRRIGLQAYYKKLIKDLEEKHEDDKKWCSTDAELELLIAVFNEQLEELKKKLACIPPFEEIDLRYNNTEKYPVPTTCAVMFCIMDISGSMGEDEKDISKRFFMLLYIFLTKQYDHIDIVFIQHHTEAKEVSEEEFFNSDENGGTIVAPSLIMMRDIIKERYSSKWNIYCCQASDGDTWSNQDANECQTILANEILPIIQYMFYIEVMRDGSGALWDNYMQLTGSFENMAMSQIHEVNEIWTVFRSFFEKKTPK
jgi:uncharacterized sporulation protein YeaH/YhbH (DUF444 family)